MVIRFAKDCGVSRVWQVIAHRLAGHTGRLSWGSPTESIAGSEQALVAAVVV